MKIRAENCLFIRTEAVLSYHNRVILERNNIDVNLSN